MLNDLNLYKIFYTVCHYQNFSHAAQALYISQPAISKSIKTLENNLGITLFSRSSKGVLLTPEGKLLYEHLDKAFSSITEGETLLNKLKNMDSGELRLGVSSTLGTHFLLPLLSEFTKTYPTLQVHVINDNTTQTLNLIEKNLIDLAIVSSPLTHNSLAFIPLMPIEDIFVCSPSYYSNIEDLSPKEICQKAYFMLLSQKSITRLHLQAHFANLGLQLIPNIEASNMDFLIECAKSGLGITSVIKSFVAPQLANGTLIEIPLAPPLPVRHIGIAYHPQLELSIASHTFINFLKQQF